MLPNNIFNRVIGRKSHSLAEAQVHYDEGVRLAAEGLYQEAVMELKLAARANPDDEEALVELGIVYHKLGQLPKAIKAYQSALEITSNCVSAYKNLGAAYDELGECRNALKAYTKAITLSPLDAELRNDLGRVYFNMGSYAEAIKAFTQALNIDPHSARARYSLGLVYLDLGDINMAVAEHDHLTNQHEKHLAFQLLDKIQLQTRQAS